MQIPAAAFIEVAKDQLEQPAAAQMVVDQQAELLMVYPEAPISFCHGYAVGLQVARVMLETNAYLGTKGVKAEDLL